MANGSFETGGALLTPWVFRNDLDATLAVDPTGGIGGSRAARVHVGVTSRSTWFVQLRQGGLALRDGASYSIAFSARASQPRVIDARVQSAAAPNPTYFQRDVRLTSDWHRYELTFNATTDAPSAFLAFNLATTSGGDVEIDDVVVAGAVPVTNGGFEKGGTTPTGWTLRNDIGGALTRDTTTASGGKASAKVTVPVAGSTPWQTQLRSAIPPIVAHQPYVLTFWAKTDVAGRSANVRLQGSVAPYPTAAESQFGMGQRWGRVSFVWTPTSSIAKAFLGFNLSGEVGTVWIDDVSLVPQLPNTISTAAGGGNGDGGPATSANLNRPLSLARDAAGNTYVVDSYDFVVRKVATDGPITTIAGNGTRGFSGDGGPATAAALDVPRTVAVDAAGNVYVGDNGNRRVRKVTPAGTITTVAGNGANETTGDGGRATQAGLGWVEGLAVDGAGNLYILANSAVRKVTTAGTITTVAGIPGTNGFGGDGGPGTAATFALPLGIVADASGNIYIADTLNSRVRKLSTGGTISTIAGNGDTAATGDGGPATSAGLVDPSQLALDGAGNLYINDLASCRVREVTPAGIISTVPGADCGAYARPSQPWTPHGVVADGAGNLYLSDGLTTIRRISATGVVTPFAGNGTFLYSGDHGPATAAALTPQGVYIDHAGNLFIADRANARVRKVTPDGTITTVAGTGVEGSSGDGGPAIAAQLDGPQAVTVDDAGNLYIVESRRNRVRKVTPGGTISTIAGTGVEGFSGDGGPANKAKLALPYDVVADHAGNLFIADFFNDRVRKVAVDGTISTYAGSGKLGDGDEGAPAITRSAHTPTSLAVDLAGNLYMATQGRTTAGECRVSKITPATAMTTVAVFDCRPVNTGAPDPIFFDIATDAAANIYAVTDASSAVRKIDPSGTVSSLLDNPPAMSGDGGPAINARVDGPVSIAVDDLANVYVADIYRDQEDFPAIAGGDRVRKITVL